MTLRTAFRRTAVGLLLLSTGCTTVSPGRDSLLSRMASLRPADSAADLPDQSEPESESDPTEEPDEPEVRQSALTATRPVRKLDPATLMLIQTELQDCAPAERDQWMSYLQSIDPAAVPAALQARRMQASRSAAAPAAGLTANSGRTGTAAFSDGHSALAGTVGAPRLDFESLNSTADSGSTGFASRLNAPEPPITAGSLAGVSPFGRQPDRDTSVPALPTGYEALLPRPESQSETTAGFTHADAPPVVMPAITPNQPREVPIAGAQSPGYLEPGRGFDVATAGIPPVAAPGSDPQTATILQGTYWQDTLQRLTALVEAEVAASQPGISDADRVAFIKRQVWLRMLYLMAEQPQRAQAAIPGLNPAEQEFWTALFWAVSNYFDTQSLPDASERAALTLQQLDYAQNRLEQLAALQLSNVSFCYKINSFGNFESWQRDEFRPGQTVLLYSEVSNFESRPQAQGLYTTRLKSFIEIRRGGADGEIVEQNSLDPTEDVCRSPRHDYFHSYTIDLPQQLSPGPYTLVLRVEDEFSGKTAVHPISFLIR